MDLYDVMTTAATTRAFTTDPVPDALLYRVLDKARYAPQGGNRQGHRVIVVRDPAMRKRLRDLYIEPWRAYTANRQPAAMSEKARKQWSLVNDRFAERMDEIPVHLVVCAYLPALAITDKDLDRPSIVGGGSIYPFVQNLLLACRNEGLGAALTTLVISREPELRPLLNLPPDYAVAAHVMVGYPDGSEGLTKLRRRPVEDFTTLETFAGPPLRSP
ncbi:MAG: nitroreductase family protein [Chloroflexi bacterium]|nr:nitroreductase family protein [Chloroflexota bacterium]